MSNYYDALETRDPIARERDLFSRLPEQIEHARQNAPAFAETLRHIDPQQITHRAALAQLPVTRKSSLLQLQKAARQNAGNVFGGFAAVGWGEKCPRVFASPGPIYEPEGARADYYRLARALYAAGFRRGDLVHNTFSYHFTPAGSMVECAAHAIGCTVFAAGIGQTEQQLAAIADLQPVAYTGTPSFLRILLEKADQADISLSFRKAFFSGEALPNSVREELLNRGIHAKQGYATADIGLIAYESEAQEGLILDENVIVEIVRPGSGEPVADGEIGELVVTTFNPDYPLIRFGTGDLSAILPGQSNCGRTNVRIKGWLGRADQTTKIKGMFVHPEQIENIRQRHPEIRRARLVVENPNHQDRMVLHCEINGQTINGLENAILDSIRELTKLRGEIIFCAPNTLAEDGKVIDDQRTYD